MTSWLLNAYTQTDPNCMIDMLLHHKAAAYLDNRGVIEKLGPGDLVFFYQNGKGVIAVGEVCGNLCRKGYIAPDGSVYPDGEYYRELCRLMPFREPVAYDDPQISAETGKKQLGILQTMSRMDDAAALVLLKRLWGIA